ESYRTHRTNYSIPRCSDCGNARDFRDPVEPVVLAEREEPLGLGGEHADGGLRLGLAVKDPVLVAARADLGALRGVGGAPGGGRRGVKLLGQPVHLGQRGAICLGRAQRSVRGTGDVKQLAPLRRLRDVRRVQVECLLARLVHPGSVSVLSVGPNEDYATSAPLRPPAPRLAETTGLSLSAASPRRPP